MRGKPSGHEEIRKAVIQWKEKVAYLRSKIQAFEADEKADASKRVEQLNRHEAIIDQYLKQLETERDKSWVDEVEALDRMFKDIDDAYRSAILNFS